MGRMLGSYADDEELDRPDLNKCPDCGCFFAQEKCPLCGKICPEHMRAGNRAKVKHKKRRSGGSGRVTFISWYHSWWFITLMMIFMPLVGIILLLTSPHKVWKKIVFVAIAVVYTVVTTFGIGNLFGLIEGIWDRPVDLSMDRTEYLAACVETDAEQFYRSPEQYEGKFMRMSLKVVGTASNWDGSVSEMNDVYYVCTAVDGTPITVIVRDCLRSEQRNLIAGDVITVFGEGDKACAVYDGDVKEWRGPCLNMAYVMIGE